MKSAIHLEEIETVIVLTPDTVLERTMIEGITMTGALIVEIKTGHYHGDLEGFDRFAQQDMTPASLVIKIRPMTPRPINRLPRVVEKP